MKVDYNSAPADLSVKRFIFIEKKEGNVLTGHVIWTWDNGKATDKLIEKLSLRNKNSNNNKDVHRAEPDFKSVGYKVKTFRFHRLSWHVPGLADHSYRGVVWSGMTNEICMFSQLVCSLAGWTQHVTDNREYSTPGSQSRRFYSCHTSPPLTWPAVCLSLSWLHAGRYSSTILSHGAHCWVRVCPVCHHLRQFFLLSRDVKFWKT